MGLVFADITLINSEDIAFAKRNIIGEDEIRQMTINMMVDSGAYMMAINETIQAQLQLPYIEKRKNILADGSIKEYEVVGPVIVKFSNRTATCNAVVLPSDSEPLLGKIPFGEMDVLIHPRRQELVVNPAHPYYAVLSLR